jgi:hypothetical protein
MPIDVEYNFENHEQSNTTETDVRTNLRVTRCCANCKFYVPKRNRANRGFCKYPDLKGKSFNSKLGETLDYASAEKSWSRAHSTMLCDLYQLRGRRTSITPISEWLGKEILNDGTVKQE